MIKPASLPRKIRSSDQWGFCLAITEHAPWPMVAVEGASHIVRQVNPAFCRLLDQSRGEIIGKPFAENMPEKDECLALLDRVYRTGKSESYTELGNPEPRPVFWSYTMWPVMEENRRVGVMVQVNETTKLRDQTVAINEALMLGSLRQHELTEAAARANAQLQQEISAHEQTEEELQLLQAQLADHNGKLERVVAGRTAELTATNQQLEAFVYSIAHDLRAPLRAMQAFSVLLVENAGTALSETGRGFANRINKSAQFMDAMLIDLLDFSRVSQQRVELAAVNLEPVVASVLSRLQKEIQEKNGQVESIGPWPAVRAHEPTLSQVLFNLANNALKFVRPGVPPRLRLRTEEQGEFIRVWVEDNGIGIAPDHLGQIFRLFIRLHGEKYPGTGIGLAIIQKGVERMGGRVGVESTPGEGSRFWFELRKA